MNELENIISGLNNTKDVSAIEKSIEFLPKSSVNPLIPEKAIEKLNDHPQRDELWSVLLTKIEPCSLSDKALQYFLDNKIGLIELGHSDLPNQWLQKFALYVEEALFTLSERYYYDDQFSAEDFCTFLKKNKDRPHMFLHLLEHYFYDGMKNRKKFNCLSCFIQKNIDDKKIKAVLNEILIAERVSLIDNTDEISDTYNNFHDSPAILLSIAENLFTPENILASLSKVSNIKFASKIRKKSIDTLKLKISI